MNLPLFAIRRHVLTSALSLMVLLAGVLAYRGLPLDRMPKINVPVLSVVTTFTGADPETVAKSVTTPLESQLNTISGVDTLSSVSGQGTSVITLSFNSSKNLQEAMTDVQSKLERAKRSLPEEADTPFVLKFDFNSQPVVQLMLTSSVLSRKELTVQANNVKKRLEGVIGVGEVALSGTEEEVIRVTLREADLAARGLTIADVVSAIQRNHLQPAAGKAKLAQRDFALKLDFEVRDPVALGAMTVAVKNGERTVLRDVASIALASADTLQIARFNGVEGVSIGITKSDDANTVDLTKALTEKVAEIQPSLPASAKLEVASEESKPVRDVVDALRNHLIEGTLLTALVIWLFLRNVRATLIVAAAIPVSLMGALAAFEVLGYTLNSFTLLALLLLIGIVVDDAIVVLENVFRVQETEGLTGEAAAEKGAGEMLFSVAATTLTLVAIFAPIMYLSGVLGQVFLPFAAVVTVGVLVSWFVAVTLTPMLCARYLKHESSQSKVSLKLEKFFNAMEVGYRRSLTVVVKRPGLVILLALSTTIPAVAMLGGVEKGFLPTQNTGKLQVRLEFAAGAPAATVSAKLAEVESMVKADTGVDTVLSTYRESGRDGSPQASLAISLKNADTQPEAVSRLNKNLALLDGVRATAGASEGGAGGAGMQFNLIGPSQAGVANASEVMLLALKQNPVTASLRHNLSLASPQATLTVDRDKAGLLGVNAAEVGQAISATTGNMTLGYYNGTDGERHPIKVYTDAYGNSSSLENMLSAKVRGADGNLYPLSAVTDSKIEGAASSVTRVSQQYAVRFSGTPNGAMGAAVDTINAAAANLGPGFSVTYAGQAAEFSKMGKSLGAVLLAALVLLYLVMASQFNNYRQPAIIMLTQPLAIIGGIGALWVAGGSLNIYSMVGMVLLIGLTAKTGILLMDRANQLQATGLTPRDAILLAAPQRLRPILMTALTVIVSLFPAALGFGPGAENNGPLSLVVVGGMLSSTLLTLYVIPAAYLKWAPKPKV